MQIGLTRANVPAPKNNACFSLKFFDKLKPNKLMPVSLSPIPKEIALVSNICPQAKPMNSNNDIYLIITKSNCHHTKKNHTKVGLDFSFFHSHSPSIHSVIPAFSA